MSDVRSRYISRRGPEHVAAVLGGLVTHAGLSRTRSISCGRSTKHTEAPRKRICVCKTWSVKTVY